MERFFNLPKRLLALRQEILQEIGVPVSIGVAATKTLAKVANHIAKKAQTTYVHWLTDPTEVRQTLASWPVGEVWGIGHRNAEKLRHEGICTALQFAQMPAAYVLKKYTRPRLQTHQELNGQPAIEVSTHREARKMVLVSRSFGAPITELPDLENALANFTLRACHKLHAEGLAATVVYCMIRTNPFRPGQPQYRNSAETLLPTPTADPAELLHHAHKLLQGLYRPEYVYKKAGIAFWGLVPLEGVQPSLFDADAQRHLRRHQLLGIARQVSQKHGLGKLDWAVFRKYPQEAARWVPESRYRSSPNLPQLRTLTAQDRAQARLWYSLNLADHEPFLEDDGPE
jgi:DNA polymerase V